MRNLERIRKKATKIIDRNNSCQSNAVMAGKLVFLEEFIEKNGLGPDVNEYRTELMIQDGINFENANN